jgi:hypothetical protein
MTLTANVESRGAGIPARPTAFADGMILPKNFKFFG